MHYIESPNNYEPRNGKKTIFLAGGINGCPNWQQEMVQLLSATNLILLNPRRKHFPINDHDVSIEQVTWEYEHLRKADAILFWFPCETLCPIALYELGAWAMTDKPLYVGVHPNYQRKQNIEVQIRLARPDVEIAYSISNLARQITQSYLIDLNRRNRSIVIDRRI